MGQQVMCAAMLSLCALTLMHAQDNSKEIAKIAVECADARIYERRSNLVMHHDAEFFADETICLVISISARDGVGSPEG